MPSSEGLTMKLTQFLDQHPVFTLDELDRFLAMRRTTNRLTRNSLLSYYRRRGRVISVRRGLYATVPVGASPESCPVDPFLLAAKMTPDAVLAYHTALEFHGKAYSAFECFFYLSNRSSAPVRFRSSEFRCVLIPRALQRKGKAHFGVNEAELSGVQVRVTSLERTLVDVLDRPDISGSYEEIWRSLESVEFFDLDKVVEYALLLANATTVAKVGFFLDQHREPLMVNEDHLKRLRDLRPRNLHYLDRRTRKPGRLARGWNLVVPNEVFDRAWAEVS
jgi:predicted transcriptional regulator of viral defense system